ncbi:dTDP-4-dehydrorhamnose 3,5-epimerase family protein [Candidatus Saccharibacteria bacterium]|nr:dTDP-4-dehydrorhamnose 3,5-epimerase family protein [Candidatus Saccharibacteria bacterium]
MTDRLAVRETAIPGLFEIDLVLHGDSRGWFKENYQKQKMEALGLPKFEVVQNNFSFNADVGVTRGLHAEPWVKFISVANGKVFGAWVDLRAGSGFGKVLTLEITPAKAVFVPLGVANGYQTLEPNVTYTYLVNEHWSLETKYVGVNLFDPALGIQWPISKDQAITSEKDVANSMLKEIQPIEV